MSHPTGLCIDYVVRGSSSFSKFIRRHLTGIESIERTAEVAPLFGSVHHHLSLAPYHLTVASATLVVDMVKCAPLALHIGIRFHLYL